MFIKELNAQYIALHGICYQILLIFVTQVAKDVVSICQTFHFMERGILAIVYTLETRDSTSVIKMDVIYVHVAKCLSFMHKILA